MKVRRIILWGICLLYVLLFVYASVSKFLNFQNFRMQLGQSPVIRGFADIIAWGIPCIELVTSFLLLHKRTRIIGLILAVLLMTMFSTYIYIILYHAVSVPCSCGGILEALGWKEHLYFNLGILLLGIWALSIALVLNKWINSVFIQVGLVAINILIGVLSVVLLYVTSERLIHYKNPFIRNYSLKVVKQGIFDLGVNSYYLAGIDTSFLYLGNYTRPLQILKIDQDLEASERITIKMSKDDLPGKAAQSRVIPPNVFLLDGQISRILKGETTDWQMTFRWDGSNQFSDLVQFDENQWVVKHTIYKKRKRAMGILKMKDSLPIQSKPMLLKKQIDGFFDVSGTLTKDPITRNMVYVYRYRNLFEVMDSLLNPVFTAHTIDTIQKAQMIIDSVTLKNQYKLISSVTVNTTAVAYNGLLFVRSKILGKYESESIWEQADVIDVYQLEDGAYLNSFYVYRMNQAPVRQIFIWKNDFYGLTGDYLVRYDISQVWKQALNSKE